MPSEIGGMPSDTPERPPVPPAYPAVHDMPPPRSSVTLTAEEQENLESELAAVRTRQDVIVAGAQAPVPARAKAKKRPAPAAAAPRVIPATTSNNTIY